MSILKTLQEPNPILRETAEPVKPENGSFLHLKNLCTDMRQTMKVLNGIGIAASQVGESKRIFLVDKQSFLDIDLPSDIFINPKLIKKSFKRVVGEEGCLSVRGIFGTVKRALAVTVEAYDLNNKKFRLSGKGLLARVLQHETDHLNGLLIKDRIK